ncbi:MAG: hypothetical protein SF066_16695 [Thermoanaerobaculia bacterium]|nr:hypothetical protein [Thermoanaerobaculia bacterium]
MSSKTSSEARRDLEFTSASEADLRALAESRDGHRGENLLLTALDRLFPPAIFGPIPPRTTTSEGWPEFEL